MQGRVCRLDLMTYLLQVLQWLALWLEVLCRYACRSVSAMTSINAVHSDFPLVLMSTDTALILKLKAIA